MSIYNTLLNYQVYTQVYTSMQFNSTANDTSKRQQHWQNLK